MLYGKDEQLSVKEFLSKKPLAVWVVIFVAICSGFAFGGYGVYQLVSTNDQEIVTSNDINSQVCEQSADFGQITVYISGAVVNPGVYVLESGNRIIDLLDASGGISRSADKIYVNRQFNLAKRLSDGDQLYIPTQIETEQHLLAQLSVQATSATSAGGGASGENSDAVGAVSQGPISINSSTKNQLMELSGIGEVRAEKIIQNRPYSNVQELVEKGVLTSSLFVDLESHISL